jgi:hypothetical protein
LLAVACTRRTINEIQFQNILWQSSCSVCRPQANTAKRCSESRIAGNTFCALISLMYDIISHWYHKWQGYYIIGDYIWYWLWYHRPMISLVIDVIASKIWYHRFRTMKSSMISQKISHDIGYNIISLRLWCHKSLIS